MNNEEAEELLQTYQSKDRQGSEDRIRKILSKSHRQVGSRDIFLFTFVNLWTSCALILGTMLNEFATSKTKKKS